MKSFFIIIIYVLTPLVLCANSKRREFDVMLSELDRVLDSADYYKQVTDSRIEQLRNKITQNRDDKQTATLNKILFSEYAKYDSEAAFELVIENENRTKAQGAVGQYAMWSINKAYLYTASGLLKESYDILDATRPLIESRVTLLEYYQQREYLLSHLGQYASGNDRLSPQYFQRKESYRDSIANVIMPEDRYYLVNKGWQHNSSDSTTYFRSLLERRFGDSNKDSQFDAMDAYTIAHMYSSQNDDIQFVRYLAEAAKIDIRSQNHDIASLQELAIIMLELGDINRAYNYLSYSLDKAKTFGDRVRVMEIATLIDSTYGLLLAENREQARRLTALLILLVILFVTVVVLLLNLNRKNNRLRSTLSSLDDANVELNRHIEELRAARSQLSDANIELRSLNETLLESNYIKENYIGTTFEVYSIHISKMERIFIKITSLVRNNKLDELRRYCDSSLLLNAELKLLYQAFDYTFLKIYPDFVSKFNELLIEDKRIKLRDGETLNTELRIYALNRLGINDNQQIASILHCSLQTIYNNYQKTKNRTELSSKELLALIMKIS